MKHRKVTVTLGRLILTSDSKMYYNAIKILKHIVKKHDMRENLLAFVSIQQKKIAITSHFYYTFIIISRVIFVRITLMNEVIITKTSMKLFLYYIK